MKKSVGTGKLFDAKQEFIRISGDRYDSMKARLAKKNLPPLPFDKTKFREDLLEVMGGSYDGVISCRYCKGYFTVGQIAIDHAKPLSRGGDIGIHNLEYICKPCNARKGSLTAMEYLALLQFLEKDIPLGRQDVLNRLEISVQLVTSARANAGVIGDLRKAGHWQTALKARRKTK